MKITAGILTVFSTVWPYECKLSLFVTLPSSLGSGDWRALVASENHRSYRIRERNIVVCELCEGAQRDKKKNLCTRFGDEITIIATIFFFFFSIYFFFRAKVLYFSMSSVLFFSKRERVKFMSFA